MKKLNEFLMKARWVLVSSCVVGLIGLSGCLNDDDDPEPIESAMVGIYHASPNTNGLDIILNISGTLNSDPFDYEDYTGYLNFYPGDRSVKIAEHSNLAPILVDTTLTFAQKRYYTVFIAGTSPNVETLVLGDSAEAPGTGKAMIRVVHLSPDAQSLAVRADEENLVSGISFTEGTAFKEINAGTLDFELISENGENEVLLSVPAVQVNSGEFLTLIIKGYTTPPGENTRELSTDFIRH